MSMSSIIRNFRKGLCGVRKNYKQYGGLLYNISEPSSITSHSIQTAKLMGKWTNNNPLAVATGLLHDYGHVAGGPPLDPAHGVDDAHQLTGSKKLLELGFPLSVALPINLHVAAKRYYYTVDPNYEMSKGSELSLQLQGGKFDNAQIRWFCTQPFFYHAKMLRRADDLAKSSVEPKEKLDDFMPVLMRILIDNHRGMNNTWHVDPFSAPFEKKTKTETDCPNHYGKFD